MRNILLDTGVFVALLDRSERNHEQCVSFFRNFKGSIFTTEPVLTEVIYLVGHAFQRQKACIEFILRGGATVVPQSIESLSRALSLMEKYKDIPMDFADATLVALSEETGIEEVLTLDIKGFSAYRIHGRKALKVLP